MYAEMDFSHNLQCAFAQNMVPLFLGLRPQKPEYVEGKIKEMLTGVVFVWKQYIKDKTLLLFLFLTLFLYVIQNITPLSVTKKELPYSFTHTYFLLFLITDKHQISLLSHDPFLCVAIIFKHCWV